MKKNVFFAPLFFYNLALITHGATKSVNPSIRLLALDFYGAIVDSAFGLISYHLIEFSSS